MRNNTRIIKIALTYVPDAGVHNLKRQTATLLAKLLRKVQRHYFHFSTHEKICGAENHGSTTDLISELWFIGRENVSKIRVWKKREAAATKNTHVLFVNTKR